MIPSRSYRFPLALATASSLLLGIAPAVGQLPARGSVDMDAELQQELLKQVEAPEGFDVSLFATAPYGMYPVCLTTAPEGVVFVCQDPNLSLDRDEGRGRIMRLVDEDGDGQADRYTVFADDIDSPRGLIFDGETLYVMHPPTLSALRDTDGDGIADESEVLVEGIGFDLDFRGADHTTNGITLGIDGWIYVAVGDYGFVKATGRDGKQLQLRGGGVVRVRPDGSEMELYTVGTRNIYDVAVDPFLNVYARDNTNDGEGWDVRLHYLPQGADMGYPSLYTHFGDEALPPLADLGAGAGTGGLWVHDPGLPEGFGNTLYTADWTLSKIFRHPLQPEGASFAVEQEEFLSIVRPADLEMDGRSNMYVASLAGGSFTYNGDEVGFIARVSPAGNSAPAAPRVEKLKDNKLVELIASPNAVHRLRAQQELLRRGSNAKVVRQLEELALGSQAPYARVAALFTLKQLQGPASHPTLLQAAKDPAVRASALRALTDRKSELAGVPTQLFIDALRDSDASVQRQAIIGLERLGAREAADELLQLTIHSDPVLSHLAINALAELQATETSLEAVRNGSPELAEAALRVLQQIHDSRTVLGLIEELEQAPAELHRPILRSLARLYNQDAVWSGNWWGTRPDRDGPYYEPVAWELSPRIRPLLRDALLTAEGNEFATLVEDFQLNRVLPKGSRPLLLALTGAESPVRAEVIGQLIGRKDVGADHVALLTRVSEQSDANRIAVARLLVAQEEPVAAAVPLLQSAALNTGLDADLRSEALAALTRVPGPEGLRASVATFAQVAPDAETERDLERAWRRFVGDRGHAREVDYFVKVAREGNEAERVLAFSVLVQIARTNGHDQAIRDTAARAVDAAWSRPDATVSLVDAITLMRAEDEYAERLEAYQSKGSRE